jgi:hypothetical protein
VKKLDSCELQALRSQAGSARCADILPESAACYRFGATVYARGGGAASWDAAGAACEALGAGARLALVDTRAKNAFLAGLFDVDGSWVNLRSELGGKGWRWGGGAAVAADAAQWAEGDGDAAADRVHNSSNGPACAAADRRGVDSNWDALSCAAARQYVCEWPSGSAADAARCGGGATFVNGETPHEPVNAADCGQVDVGVVCSEGEDAAVAAAEPFCPEKGGQDFTEFDRTCCGGRADLLRKGGRRRALGVGGIVGIAAAGLALLALLVAACLCCLRRRRRRRAAEQASAASKGTPSEAGTGGPPAAHAGIPLQPTPLVVPFARRSPAVGSGSTVSAGERQYSFDDPVSGSLQDVAPHGAPRVTSHASGSGGEDNYGYG